MYNIGLCKICKQGLLEIVKDEKTNKIYIGKNVGINKQ